MGKDWPITNENLATGPLSDTELDHMLNWLTAKPERQLNNGRTMLRMALELKLLRGPNALNEQHDAKLSVAAKIATKRGSIGKCLRCGDPVAFSGDVYCSRSKAACTRRAEEVEANKIGVDPPGFSDDDAEHYGDY